MFRKRSSICLFATILFSVFNTYFAYSQRIDQDINLANSLKKKYGDDVHVVCLQSTNTVTFKYSDLKKDSSCVTADVSIDEKLISLKDNYDFSQSIYHDENSFVSDIKAYGKNNRPTDVYSDDVSVNGDNEFYSGETAKVFDIPFQSLGEIERYTAHQYFGDLKYFWMITFPDYYPYEEKTIIFDVPKWLKIDFKEENFTGFDITKTVTEDSKTHDSIYTFTAKNLGQIHSNEGNTPNMWSMLPHILVLSKSYTNSKGKTVDIINSMDDLYAFMESLVKNAGNDDDLIKKFVTQLTQGKKTDIDKIKAIYYWVQDNIRYIAFENGISGLKPASCQDVYNDKYGDCKGMANLMTVMLKDAGFDARRTWIGVQGIPYNFSTPMLGLFNHVICTLVYKGKNYYLDGVEKYQAFGHNSDWIQGKSVLVEDGDKYLEEKIPVESVDSTEDEMTENVTLSNANVLTGTEINIYHGDSKTGIVLGYNMAASSERKEILKGMLQDNKNMEVTNIVTSDLQNREIPVTISYDFSVKDQANAFDNDVYLTLDSKKWLANFTFDSTRYCDYSFRFRKELKQTINFTVPAGYKVKHIPDNVNIQNKGYSIEINITQVNNKIIYQEKLAILIPIIKKENFKIWNADMAMLQKTYDDQFVLEKE